MEKENVVPENKSAESLLDKAAAAVPKTSNKVKAADSASATSNKPAPTTNSFDS